MTHEIEPLALVLDALRAALEPRLTAPARAWLVERREEIRSGKSSLGQCFAAVGRRTGRGPLLDPPSAQTVRLADDGPILNPWRVEDAARAVLLLEDRRREPVGSMERAVALYFAGDGRERIAVVRSLQLLGAEEAGLAAVKDALRVNAIDLFSAAICENRYTSRRLSEPLFFQAVLKCAFVGLDFGRIEGLEERANPELSRMLLAFVTEREHAGRPVPSDLWPILALHPPTGVAERIEALLARARDPYEKGQLEKALQRAAGQGPRA